MKTCPVCGSTKHPSAFSAVKHICNLCHLDGKTYTPPEKPKKPSEAEILQAELAARTLARRRLIHFVQRFKPDYQAGWVHHDICRRLERFMRDVEAKKSPRLLLCMPPRAGKALALDTPVPTPTGWTTMGDLRVGDTVFSDSGEVCRVVAKSPVWKDREAYVVKTDTGDRIVADAEHEWVVRLCRKKPTFKVKTTRQLAERTSPRAPLLARSGALNLPAADLPIHPYVLGVWLGDGRCSSSAMCSADPEIVERVSAIEGGHNEYENRNGTVHFRAGPHYRDGAAKVETLQGRLRSLGLLDNKHIPTIYLRASREQRLELLQGLIDTDGYVADNGLIEFCNTNKTLAEGVRELVNSLGVKASLSTGRAMCNGKDCGPKYRVHFMLENAAKLTRKRVKTRNGVKQPGTYLTFEPAGRVDTVCIEVDAPSHQFLCGRTMIPTHNSELTSRNFPAWVLGHHPEWEIIAASHTQSLALSFSRHLRDKIRDPAYEVVFPDCVLDPQSQSVENWNTTAGGGYLAAGVGSGITGRGCHILIIDDPVKDMEASDSQLIRDNTWDWYTCFHPETEILTYDGWKPVSEVALREAVATMDMSSGEMYYMPAVEVQSYDFDGELVDVWQRSGVSYRVTPNHNLHIASSKTGPIRTVRADETPETFYIPRSAKVFLGGTPPARTGFRAQHVNGKDFSCATTTWFKFFGAWLGDGSIYAPRGQVVLSAIKPRKRKFFTKVLSEMGVTFWEQERKVTFQNVEVARYLERFGGSHEKYIPENMKHAATPYLEALLEGLFETDGHAVDVDRRYRYVTTSKQLADDVMEIAVKCGYAVSYSVRPIGTYHLSLRKTYMTQVDTRVRGKTNTPVRQMVPYKGKVYCVTVPPHHSVLIRDRGRISWSGQSTAYTRLAPGGGVLGIMTLWNDDDWGGRTITYSENGEGDKFEIVRYPAINEGYDEYQDNETFSIIKKYPADPVPENATLIRTADSALHPERYDIEMLLKIKRNLYASGQQRVWSALYQQNPAPEEGAYFTKDLFRYYSTPPRRKGNFIYQAWDFAITEGQENDYTVGATILQDERDALHVLDIRRFKSTDSLYIVDVILDYAAEYDADLIGFEDGQIWKTMQAQFDKRCEERRMYPTYEILKPLTDKKARANPLKGRMQAGKVLFDAKAPWFHDLYTELLRFPAGKHDDQIDALAWCVRLTLTRSAPKPQEPARIKSWKDKLLTGGTEGVSHMAA